MIKFTNTFLADKLKHRVQINNVKKRPNKKLHEMLELIKLSDLYKKQVQVYS